jgi:hypothetical protein
MKTLSVRLTKSKISSALFAMFFLFLTVRSIQAQTTNCVSVTTYGAKGDAIRTGDGVSTASSSVFTSSSSSFSSADVGKFIEITGAGPQGATLATTIASLNSSTSINLAASASTSGTSLSFIRGTDNTSALTSALASGNPICVPEGNYVVSGTISGSTPLVINGSGPQSVLLSDTVVFNMSGTGASGTTISNIAFQPLASFTVVSATYLAGSGAPATATPLSGTPVLIDYFGTGIGQQPTNHTFWDSSLSTPAFVSVWSKFSSTQQNQTVGPTISVQGADHVTISGIVGNQVSVQLFDVTNSSLQDNNFIGGKGTVYGCLGILSQTSSGLTNTGDQIMNNTVQYCGYSNIYWGNSDGLLVQGNTSEHSGEAGFKNFQQSTTHPSKNISVIDNLAESALDVGYDLSADYPHAATYETDSTATGNVAKYNEMGGFYMDGIRWTFSGNVAVSNLLSGFSLDLSDSTITNNIAFNNNTSNTASGYGQFILGNCCSLTNDIVSGNIVTITNGVAGPAMWLAASNVTASNNTVQGGTISFPTQAAQTSVGNSDSSGADPNVLSSNSSSGIAIPLTLASYDTSANFVDLSFFPRRPVLANDVARLRADLQLGTSGQETGGLAVLVRNHGTQSQSAHFNYDGSVTFNGNVSVLGTLTKAAGSFRIDHPLDPEKKFLQHSFVESPDMLNIYEGQVTLGKGGRARVKLPAYFEALNNNFHYQLTCVGRYARVYISREIRDNEFEIAGGKAGMKVSWQVTGVRQDSYAKEHRIQVEVDKSPSE